MSRFVQGQSAMGLHCMHVLALNTRTKGPSCHVGPWPASIPWAVHHAEDNMLSNCTPHIGHNIPVRADIGDIGPRFSGDPSKGGFSYNPLAPITAIRVSRRNQIVIKKESRLQIWSLYPISIQIHVYNRKVVGRLCYVPAALHSPIPPLATVDGVFVCPCHMQRQGGIHDEVFWEQTNTSTE